MGFQGAKYDDIEKREDMIKWINDFEFDFLKLPYPDLILYFDLPIDIIKNRLESNRVGDDRNYLNGELDIHEKSLDLQTKVRNIYLGLTNFKNYKIINCLDKDENVLSPEELFETYKKINNKMRMFDCLIDVTNSEPIVDMEYLYLMDMIWKPGKPEHDTIKEGTVMLNVKKRKK